MARFTVTEKHLLALEPLATHAPGRYMAAFTLLGLLGSFAAKRETDGEIDRPAQRRLTALLPTRAVSSGLRDLCAIGLVEQKAEGGLSLDWTGQLTAKKAQQLRAAEAARQRRSRARRNDAMRSAALTRVTSPDTWGESGYVSPPVVTPRHLSQVPETIDTDFSDDEFERDMRRTGPDFAQFSTTSLNTAQPRPRPLGAGSEGEHETLYPRARIARTDASAPVRAREDEETAEAATRGERETSESNAVEPDWMAQARAIVASGRGLR